MGSYFSTTIIKLDESYVAEMPGRVIQLVQVVWIVCVEMPGKQLLPTDPEVRLSVQPEITLPEDITCGTCFRDGNETRILDMPCKCSFNICVPCFHRWTLTDAWECDCGNPDCTKVFTKCSHCKTIIDAAPHPYYPYVLLWPLQNVTTDGGRVSGEFVGTLTPGGLNGTITS